MPISGAAPHGRLEPVPDRLFRATAGAPGMPARRRDVPPRFAKRIESVRSLSTEELDALGAVFGPAAIVEPSTDLLIEGERVRHGYILDDGWACKYRLLKDGRRQILNFVVPGDVVGAAGDLIRVSDHSVATLTPCRVHLFPATSFAAVGQRFPRVGEALLWSARRELAMLQERVVDLGRRTALERVAHLILELLHRLRVVGLADDGGFDLPLTQGMIGDALGLSIVHVNRTLRRLNEQRVILYRPGRITAIDTPALERIAEFDEDYLHHWRLAPAAGRAAVRADSGV
jgi:CRP-like cAMP-binding protein